MIPSFAIFYEDGSIVEGGGDCDELVTITLTASKKWLEAPSDGVQGGVYVDQDGKVSHFAGTDFFFPLVGGIEYYGTNDLGAFLRNRLGGLIKFGYCIPTEEYNRHKQRMKDYAWQLYQEKIKPYKKVLSE